MLEEAELAEEHGEHIHAVGAGEELIPHEEEGAAALAGDHGIHHLEDGTLRGRGGDGADGIRMDDGGIPGMGGDLGDLAPGLLRLVVHGTRSLVPERGYAARERPVQEREGHERRQREDRGAVVASSGQRRLARGHHAGEPEQQRREDSVMRHVADHVLLAEAEGVQRRHDVAQDRGVVLRERQHLALGAAVAPPDDREALRDLAQVAERAEAAARPAAGGGLPGG